ncbi:PqqD family protein [Aliiruegeria lutimaris]|uniref:Coenzyme PQQ synthesis protein D (PqqD) n=1 Tax=Aliiruegeria lutimaris TaxID=571298 RepID=A0A1G8Q6H1_9RHOB|nr:PqqD family protein [Aliiruegeria lutimaris]SDJ00281.1 Coenzyme PQQ synthesis protein D (PqqD) [Aliiruegeria lutimaris]
MNATYATTDGVLESKLGDETVLLDMESGQYFGLDPVGSFVWHGLKDGKAPAEIIARLSEEFTDVPDSARADVVTFLRELAEKKLISPNA